mgnify:CR=1 FL=1|tara:strand:+ start:1979 stop:2698 length:720 start_codon:yes stop_codon:yes gene_type:complete
MAARRPARPPHAPHAVARATLDPSVALLPRELMEKISVKAPSVLLAHTNGGPMRCADQILSILSAPSAPRFDVDRIYNDLIDRTLLGMMRFLVTHFLTNMVLVVVDDKGLVTECSCSARLPRKKSMMVPIERSRAQQKIRDWENNGAMLLVDEHSDCGVFLHRDLSWDVLGRLPFGDADLQTYRMRGAHELAASQPGLPPAQPGPELELTELELPDLTGVRPESRALLEALHRHLQPTG